jgi:hypothetical protein
MKKIYFRCNGISDEIITIKDAQAYSNGYYKFTDILGSEYALPIVNTILITESFDGDFHSASTRYHNAIQEMNGKETGAANVSKNEKG